MYAKPQPVAAFVRQCGMSLVELLVGIAIAMIASVFMLQLFSVNEGQQRVASGGADAITNGQIALFQIERDLRMAGLSVGAMSCPDILIFYQGLGTQSVSTFPVRLSADTNFLISASDYVPDDSDQVEVLYSASPLGAIPSVLQTAMPTSSSVLRVDDGHGFFQGELVLLGDPAYPSKPCAIVQMSKDGQRTGTANTTTSGTMWNLLHSSGSFPYNTPNGTDFFPAGDPTASPPIPAGYGVGALAFRLGDMVRQRYRISNNDELVVDDLSDPSAVTTITLAKGVVALKGLYAIDTSVIPDGVADEFWSRDEMEAKIAGNAVKPHQVVGARIALVVRNSQYDREYTSPFASGKELWDGGPVLTIGGTYGPNYRYAVLQTAVPFRNVIWNTP
ncbi:PilW family protein [Nitrogeniibacter aestuarii]|uniref:PilW family protein n=1 Tax=Nitrogeniibacter aestuarii TaxID=2815343 RepID=UPI001E2F2E51|nr:PilW family protein [Nitrogeniibacter aestuarii]